MTPVTPFPSLVHTVTPGPRERVMPLSPRQVSQLRAAHGYEGVKAMHREYGRLVSTGACSTCALRVTLVHAGLSSEQVGRVLAGEVLAVDIESEVAA